MTQEYSEGVDVVVIEEESGDTFEGLSNQAENQDD